jgi:hypothetical protein
MATAREAWKVLQAKQVGEVSALKTKMNINQNKIKPDHHTTASPL